MAVGSRYRVGRLLGRGGLGEVWEATDHTLGRRVAIKFVTGVTQYPEAAQRFAREARTLASLRHGSVVTVHDAGTADHDNQPLPYLVMELLDGATWEFSHVDSVVETGAHLADVLAHVHAAKVVHRDIKPANIMICADGRTVLMDFGIARDDASLTRTATTTGRYFGTPGYMAPEQLQGRAATPASDVYALGIVLIEKLTGHRLPVTQLMPQVQSSICEPVLALLARMTAARPEERPTAAECASLLRASSTTTTSRRVPSTRRERLERLGPPAALLALHTIILFRPAYRPGYWNPSDSVIESFGKRIVYAEEEDFLEWNARAWGAFTTVGAGVGVATLLVAVTLLVLGSRVPTRLAGYGAVALTVVCLGWQATSNPPYEPSTDSGPPVAFGLWLFYLVTALTIAMYVYHDVRARRVSARP
ncbi:serine/threonine-protein kinase [Streptomyces alboniger]|uniref:non-specific serine/threonine protein kinase n=1 Tax=Streptomyces alboniger TaxID=132473 RepID=A0A5J6H7Z1_STRAD|nr:serine/threonine-protein kinase [Streptomyces alboniger]QEV16216.1 serine/threonine protein kinase [Streptomyces alboniger]